MRIEETKEDVHADVAAGEPVSNGRRRRSRTATARSPSHGAMSQSPRWLASRIESSDLQQLSILSILGKRNGN